MIVMDQYDAIGLNVLFNRPYTSTYKTDLLNLRSEEEYVYALNLAAYTRSYMKNQVPNPN